jgi:hypothetical protein
MKKHVLLFNKVSKEFFATVSYNALKAIDKNFFITKIVEFDDNTHEWDGGNLDNGKVVLSTGVLPPISETELDKRCAETIQQEYKPYHEFNIIIDVLSEIIEKENMSSDAVNKFTTMRDYIAKRRLMNERYKAAYIESPNFSYKSKEEEKEEYNRLLDGGLAERIKRIESYD